MEYDIELSWIFLTLHSILFHFKIKSRVWLQMILTTLLLLLLAGQLRKKCLAYSHYWWILFSVCSGFSLHSLFCHPVCLLRLLQTNLPNRLTCMQIFRSLFFFFFIISGFSLIALVLVFKCMKKWLAE